MKNKSTKKRTVLKTALVIAVIGGALAFLLPSRCGNENAKTGIPLPDDLRFESGSSAWVEPEKTGSRAERHDEAPPVSAPFTVIAPVDTGSSGVVETQEKSVMIETSTSEKTDGIVILPEKNESGKESSVIPIAAIAETERTAATETIPVLGETAQGQPANIQAEETKAVTETADKNKMLPPREIVKKIDAVLPESASNKGTERMLEVNPESLKSTVGISKERAALDVKNVSGTGSTSTIQRASPPSAGNKGVIAKSTLPPPKDTTGKNVERVPVTIPESDPDKGLVNKNERITADDSEESADKSPASRMETEQKELNPLGKTEQKAFGKSAALSIGILFEGNRATSHGWGLGAGLIAGYEISQSFTVGAKGIYGNDMRNIESFEGLLYGRYYLPFKKEEFGIFAQLGIGGITFTEDRTDAVSSVMMDISLGARLFLGNFYVEPYLRVGYMVQVGAGLAFGYRLEG